MKKIFSAIAKIALEKNKKYCDKDDLLDVVCALNVPENILQQVIEQFCDESFLYEKKVLFENCDKLEKNLFKVPFNDELNVFFDKNEISLSSKIKKQITCYTVEDLKFQDGI